MVTTPRKFKLSRFLKAFWQFFALPSVTPKRVPLSSFQNSRGSALVMAAIFMLVSTTLITVGVKLISNASRSAKEKELYVGEAENVARAGLVDAIGWFRRQSGNGGIVEAYNQPNYQPGSLPVFNTGVSYVDQVFSPGGNTTNPIIADSIAASIGLVQEYPLNASVTANALYWARYEVRKQGSGALDPDAVHDVTGARSGYVSGDGFVWSVTSVGYVYKRLDLTTDSYGNWLVSYNQLPNKVVALAKFNTELRKLSLVMPVPNEPYGPGPSGASSGLYVENILNQVTLANNQCLLDGAVSAIGTYGSIGETSP
jgi:hypothetical protein